MSQSLADMPIEELEQHINTIWKNAPPGSPIQDAARDAIFDKWAADEWYPAAEQPKRINWLATYLAFRKSSYGGAEYVEWTE